MGPNVGRKILLMVGGVIVRSTIVVRWHKVDLELIEAGQVREARKV